MQRYLEERKRNEKVEENSPIGKNPGNVVHHIKVYKTESFLLWPA